MSLLNKKFLQGPGAVFSKRAPGRRRHFNFMTTTHDAAPSPGDERKPTQTVCAAYRSPMPWGFMTGKVNVTIFLQFYYTKKTTSPIPCAKIHTEVKI